MSDPIFFDILDDSRKDVVPLFEAFKEQFYLAGGTGLALQIGHRDSNDFDFFSDGSFSAPELLEEVRSILVGHELITMQLERDTLTVIVDNGIKVSFFGYPYPLSRPLVSANVFRIASIEDIGCMKLAAVIGRATLKDYVDLYFIIRRFPLPSLLDLAGQKYSSFNSALALKSLTYFDDIVQEPILFKHGADVSFDEVRLYLTQQVKRTFDSGWV